MKVLLDQGLPRSAAALLREYGVNAIHVGELGMAAAQDETILEYASSHRLAVITLDADFHTLLALSCASEPSVIRLREQGLKGEGACELIRSVLANIGEELQNGVLVSVRRGLVRIKRLPVKSS